MMPRLPVNIPRSGVAMISPDGVTRFCSGIGRARAAMSRRAVADRRLERQRGVPWEEYPGVLRDLGDEGIDQRPALRLGIDRGEMRLRHHVAHQPPGLAGVDEIVDDQEPLA